ncbi:MAG: hypothetical protein PHE47_09620 [Oscillospiraceae bacterium]|nr:hypothetical protein [Oscillospiraceae bacterium]
MLEMHLQPPVRAWELFQKEGMPCGEGCGAFGVTERESLLGYCLFCMDGPMRMLSVWCEDDFLLDGLVRATLNHGSLSGAEEADFSALSGPVRDKLEQLGYFRQEPLPIEWFFANCKPCKE